MPLAPRHVRRRVKTITNEGSPVLVNLGEGLEDIRYLIANCRRYLKPTGALVCEMGCGQREGIQDICDELFPEDSYRISFSKDLAGLDRVFELSF